MIVLAHQRYHRTLFSIFKKLARYKDCQTSHIPLSRKISLLMRKSPNFSCLLNECDQANIANLFRHIIPS
jgi:hypothetical protein